MAKVGELMSLCAELEETQEVRERRRNRLATTAQRRMVEATADPETFRASAGFYLERLPRLATRPEHISELRRTILDLAAHGALAPREDSEGSSSELRTEIEHEKISLIRDGVIKQRKPLTPISKQEIPFDIPSHWEWVRLGEITSYIQRGKSPKYGPEWGPLVISQKCVQWDGLDLTRARTITAESLGSYEPSRFVREGDLLWNSTGTGTIGRVIRIVNPPENLICDSHVTVVRVLKIDPEYVRSWLRSDHVYGLIEGQAAGSTNQVELTQHMATHQPVPLPPLGEQIRIVAKVDELMAVCDELEKQLVEGSSKRSRLLETVLHEALHSAA